MSSRQRLACHLELCELNATRVGPGDPKFPMDQERGSPASEGGTLKGVQLTYLFQGSVPRQLGHADHPP